MQLKLALLDGIQRHRDLHGIQDTRYNIRGILLLLTGVYAMDINLELKERFSEKWELNKTNNCWEWTASCTPNGYGQIKRPHERGQIPAHRLSYLIHVGDIPDGIYVCHTCDNRKCVKPSHLFLGTADDNAKDMVRKNRHTHGVTGHNVKLNDNKVRRIHSLYESGISQGDIAKSFGVTQGTVWKILHGHKWKHVYNDINKVKGDI